MTSQSNSLETGVLATRRCQHHPQAEASRPYARFDSRFQEAGVGADDAGRGSDEPEEGGQRGSPPEDRKALHGVSTSLLLYSRVGTSTRDDSPMTKRPM